MVALLVLIAADYALSMWMRKAQHPNNEIWDEVMSGKIDADVIALGSSRANTSFYPAVIDSVLGTSSWNLGVLGHHFTTERLRYDMFRLHNRPPRLVVQFVDPMFFSSRNGFDRVQFLPWFWDRDFRNGVRKYFGIKYLVKNSFPFFRYHGFLPWEVSSIFRQTDRGFHTYNSDKEAPFVPTYKEPFQPEQGMREIFVRMITSLQEEGVSFVLVRSPEYESIDYEPGASEALNDYMKSVSEETGAPYLDYSQMAICSDSTCFIDIWHLNLKGAKIFSDTLANDIKSIEKAGMLIQGSAR